MGREVVCGCERGGGLGRDWESKRCLCRGGEKLIEETKAISKKVEVSLIRLH